MNRRISIPVRAFGEEISTPGSDCLVEWIRKRRGQEGDLITCLLDLSLEHQEGVNTPCIGGVYYGRRWVESLEGVEDGMLVEEPGPDSSGILMDLAILSGRRKPLWWTVPAPHLLGIEDAYFGDSEELLSAISDCYLSLMREMRDRGISGHILLCEKLIEEEMEMLSSRKRQFFKPDMSPEELPLLLEYQPEVAITSELLPHLEDLMGEYTVRKVALLDPAIDAFNMLLELLDERSVEAGGYCTGGCEVYWKDLISKAFVLR